MNNDCKKKSFATGIEAQTRANEINRLNRGLKDTTHLRPYKCHKCQTFHLSSMKKHIFKMIKYPEIRYKKKTEMFIRKESEYWEEKLSKNKRNKKIN